MGVFDNAIFYLDSLGLTGVILPFMLIFTVLFALLQRVAVFKEGKTDKPSKRINSIIALTIALITVIPHVTGSYPSDADPITIINTFLPGAVVITIVVLLFLMISGFVGSKTDAEKSPLVALAGIIAVIGLALVLWRSLYPNGAPDWLWFFDDPQLRDIVIVLLIMGLVVWAVTHEKETDPKKTFKNSLQQWFGGE